MIEVGDATVKDLFDACKAAVKDAELCFEAKQLEIDADENLSARAKANLITIEKTAKELRRRVNRRLWD